MPNIKSVAATLAVVHQRLTHTTFDPRNAEHVSAYDMLVHHGRQHPTLRFDLEHPFVDVRSMMMTKVSRAYVQAFTQARSKLTSVK